MFLHLKAKDFVNLMEGIELPEKYRAHLDACADCRSRWHALESVQAGERGGDDRSVSRGSERAVGSEHHAASAALRDMFPRSASTALSIRRHGTVG